MDETLDIALARIFGGNAGLPPRAAVDSSAATPAPSIPSAPMVASPLLQEARDHYDRAIAAQKAGDWATYGEEIRKLGDLLRQLSR
jgi:uncharacterized protein